MVWCARKRASSAGYLPIGLASQAKLVRPVAKDAMVTYADVAVDETLFSYRLRKAMEDAAKGVSPGAPPGPGRVK